jgi:hypothetical protein
MHNKNAERKMPEKPKSSPKRLKLSEDSKPKSSTKNDSNKKFK